MMKLLPRRPAPPPCASARWRPGPRSRSTLRFYEKLGLLPRPARTPAGYRLYDAAAVDRVAFIGKAQALGLTLDEVREIVRVADRGTPPCEHVRRTLVARLADGRSLRPRGGGDGLRRSRVTSGVPRPRPRGREHHSLRHFKSQRPHGVLEQRLARSRHLGRAPCGDHDDCTCAHDLRRSAGRTFGSAGGVSGANLVDHRTRPPAAAESGVRGGLRPAVRCRGPSRAGCTIPPSCGRDLAVKATYHPGQR